MYYHKTSAFEKPTLIPGQEFQPELENGSKINWVRYILIAGLILVVGFYIGIAIKNIKKTQFKNNKPDKNQETE